MSLRLAVLDCDHLATEVRSRYHSYGQMFIQLFARLAPEFCVERFSVIDGIYPNPTDHYDAWLVTGSKSDAFSDEAWIIRLTQYLQQLNQQQRCLIGICFGHQLLAHMLNGRVGRAEQGWGVGVHSYQTTQHPLLSDFENRQLKLIVSHQDQVLKLPDTAIRLWGNQFCPNAAFLYDSRVLGIQGHPEFSCEYAAWLYQFRAQQLADRLEPAIKSLENHRDEVAVVRMISQLVRQCRVC